MATISGCRHLRVNLKAKIYIYVNSSTQRCPNKTIKIFLLEGFFHLPPVSLTPVENLELRISTRIFEKIRNGANGIIRGLGETDSRKKPEAKNLVTLSVPLTLPVLQIRYSKIFVIKCNQPFREFKGTVSRFNSVK
jgi:hypothetical protein